MIGLQLHQKLPWPKILTWSGTDGRTMIIMIIMKEPTEHTFTKTNINWYFIVIFQCKCCEMEPGIISSMMPDLCIVYKLHLECTQLINLFDWLQVGLTSYKPYNSWDHTFYAFVITTSKYQWYEMEKTCYDVHTLDKTTSKENALLLLFFISKFYSQHRAKAHSS